ncbi:MAG: NAD(P)/FAD-dependent oxidoreductase [Bacillota bacterium]
MTEVAIIGGGISGLSAGIFAQLNQLNSVIIEKHTEIGGQCTGWNREGYHIDGCIHWLVGTKEGTPINELWKTLGALGDVPIHHPETFQSFEVGEHTVHLYRELSRLRSSLLDLSPKDGEMIDDFCDSIATLQSFDVPVGKPQDMMGIWERLRSMMSMKEAGIIMQRFGKISLKEYAARFEHPAIREALGSLLPEGYAASSLFFALAAFTKGQASIPMGGSKALAERMRKRYLALGGQVKTGCEIRSLKIENSTAVGALYEGGQIQADYFVAACDAHHFYEELLQGKYIDPQFHRRFEDADQYPLASQVMIALGYEGSMMSIPRTLSFPVTPFSLLGDPIDRLTISHFTHEPDFAPKGHTLITCAVNQFADDYDAWWLLSRDRTAYAEEKRRIGKSVRLAIERRFPEMRGELRVLDVATPTTYERYCNAFRGAFMAFLPTVGGKMMAHSGRVRGVKNIFLSGQWLQPPGGLPVAAITGRDTIMRICKSENRQFNAG